MVPSRKFARLYMGAMYGRFQSHRLIGAEGLHKWTLNGGESASLDNHWLQDAVFLTGTFNHKSLLPWTCDKDTSTYICNIYIYTHTHMHTCIRTPGTLPSQSWKETIVTVICGLKSGAELPPI